MKKRPKYTWLNQVSNNIAKQAVKDACDAYKKWFDGMTGKSRLRAEKPRFKSRKKSKPAFYNDNIKLKVKAKAILLEKIGWVKTSEQIPMNTKYSNSRISFAGKYWYVSVGIDEVQPIQTLTGEILVINLGIKDLVIVSNGKVYKNINKQEK